MIEHLGRAVPTVPPALQSVFYTNADELNLNRIAVGERRNATSESFDALLTLPHGDAAVGIRTFNEILEAVA